MDSPSAENSTRPAPVRMLAAVLRKLRRFAGGLLALFQRNEIVELGEQTRRLGAASVESATYVNGELQALDERLGRIEAELAALREALAERQPS